MFVLIIVPEAHTEIVPLTLFVVADLDSDDGRKLIQEALISIVCCFHLRYVY
jgi:hypothetical protein